MPSSSRAAPRPPPPPAPTAPSRDDAAPRAQRVRFGILARTTVTMLAVGVLPLVAFGGLNLVQQARAVRRDARQSLQASGERITTQVDEWVDKNVRALRAASTLPAITAMRTD